jgi:NADH-quinone oxidoreductase subunit K
VDNNFLTLTNSKALYFTLQNNNINTLDHSIFIFNEFIELNFIILSVILSITLFLIGIFNMILNINNLLIALLNIELIFLGLSILFISISLLLGDPKGQIYALLILSTAAAESAIGLGLLIALYRLCGSISITKVNNLKG